jgi:ammonia channel protein AmtB
MLIGGGGAFLAYKMHYWVENRFKIDDAVGAVAVHGYAGFYGIVVAGFMLWGYPSSPFEGYATISPWGNFIGALIMFFVLGFIPAWIVSKILHSFGMLRIPREVELVGLDINTETQRAAEADEVAQAVREAARSGA